jgi:hypothetical protein
VGLSTSSNCQQTALGKVCFAAGEGTAVQFISATQPNNEFGEIRDLKYSNSGQPNDNNPNRIADGLYIFNSRTVDYGRNGELANPLPVQNPTAVLGLKISGLVSGDGFTVIRTLGDLVLLGKGTVTTTKGDIYLSAETSKTATSGNFHNLAGTLAADGTPIPNTTAGAVAVQPGIGSRFLIFSTDAKQNFGEVLVGGKVTFNGLGADFIADQTSFGDHRTPIVKQNAQQDNGIGNGFVFVQKQAILQTDESAKFFFDLLTVAIVNAVDATAEVDKLPPERPPTIWTSSYHLYLEEKKKKKKRVVEHQGPVLVANVAGE